MKFFTLTIIRLGILSLLVGSVPALAEQDEETWKSDGWPQWHHLRGEHPFARTGTQIYFGQEGPLDADGDGVPDEDDACPNTLKGMRVDTKGCPVDEDMDGVLNEQDLCPHTPPGAKVDSHGCPVDTDGDGVPDHLDKCSNTPSGVSVTPEGCWVIKDINFRPNRADIPPGAHISLDAAVRVLKENPGMNFEIQGHTDSSGRAKKNEMLSRKRAEAVRNYLVRHGIAKLRLTAKGYGSSRPVAENVTLAGRAINRRVELRQIP
ncbi:MAG: OmpA family protein [Magnetococcales bacterium]|nr:OmpA family protein [Magnetococcales bacterium]MBF0321583.1 OmpA family protein [Magnetococcales bacterium]